MDGNRKKLHRKYPSLKSYTGKFEITPALFNTFLKDAGKAKVKMDSVALKHSIRFIKLQIKALIARDLFNQNAYFEVMATMDHTIRKALDVMQNDTVFMKLHIQE